MLSPYSNEKVDLLHIAEKNYARELDQNEMLSKFLRKFLTFELMPFNDKEIEGDMRGYLPFQEQTEHHRAHMQEFLR